MNIFTTLGLIPIFIAYASLFEWCLHRFVMHRPVKGLRFAFEKHAHVHHHIFKADESYHLRDEADKAKIPMAWWNGAVMILIASTPCAIFGLISNNWQPWGMLVVVLGIYYGAYESLHWCMHLPKKPRARLIERSWIFRRLNGHHLLHHRYMGKNFNVVLPLWDWIFGTLLLRAPQRFNQPNGIGVPDVQPPK